MPVIIYERQRQILDFLSQFIQRNGFAPSLSDIAKAMGLRSLATVHEHLSQLERKGIIKISGSGKRRKIEIVDKRLGDIDKGVRLPILGYFSEGSAIEPYPTPHAAYSVAPSMITGRKRSFILQVKDDLLSDEGILKGDFIILQEEPGKVEDETIVIALLDSNQAVLKRFFQETTRARLECVRSKKAPIFVDSIKIQGKVLGVIRNF